MGRRTNYSFEKRQKELKRAKKKEEKLARKRGKKEGDELAVEGIAPVAGEEAPAEGEAAPLESGEEAAQPE